MKSTPVKRLPEPPQPAVLEREFARLADRWRQERGPSSSMTRFLLHPAYQRIIGMGPAAVPFILRELRRFPDHWFWALYSITGENPVAAGHARHLEAMTRDWLKWAKNKGYAVDGPNRKTLSKAG